MNITQADRDLVLCDLHAALCTLLSLRDPEMAAEQRRAAAEDVCFTVLLMMGLGELEIPIEARKWLADPMQKWAGRAL